MRFSHKDERSGRGRIGASMLEFTFVGIPLMFILVSVFEISRAMWVYNSVAQSVKHGVRFAMVHGNNCSIAPNACTVTASQVCQVMRDAAPGLEPDRLQQITLVKTISAWSQTYADLNACIADNVTIYPSSGAGNPGGGIGQPIEITANYQFDSALAFFWTGSRGFTFGRLWLPASAKERIQY